MITVLGHNTCPFCKQAIHYLASRGKSFNYLDARETVNQGLVTALKDDGVSAVPQIWIDKKRIGGFDKLKEVM